MIGSWFDYIWRVVCWRNIQNLWCQSSKTCFSLWQNVTYCKTLWWCSQLQDTYWGEFSKVKLEIVFNTFTFMIGLFSTWYRSIKLYLQCLWETQVTLPAKITLINVIIGSYSPISHINTANIISYFCDCTTCISNINTASIVLYFADCSNFILYKM
jgi:hypothetical protein